MEDIWFTSDTHFFHTNVIKYDERPFQSVEEMNETIIERWNNKVKKTDTIFHLGDFSFAKIDKTIPLAKRLNGNIRLILGNHDDKKLLGSTGCFHTIDSYLEVRKLQRSPIALFHFPIHSWNAQHYGAVHLHGHCHGTVPSPGLRRFDVGSNCWGYSPVNWEEIKALLPSKDEEYLRMKAGELSDPNSGRVFQRYDEIGKPRHDYT